MFTHPTFDMESRMVQVELGDLTIASVYVPNGGKDFPAKLGFLTQLADWSRRLQADGRQLLLCGDINIALTDLDVHPKERKLNTVGSGRTSAPRSTQCWGRVFRILGGSSIRRVRVCSPGGRRGAI